MNLVDKAIRSQFIQYFPNPDTLKKRRSTENYRTAKQQAAPEKEEENPYRPITQWFDKGNNLNISFNTTDKEKILLLYKVDGLHAMVKKYFAQANEAQAGLLMEFVLHGLASYSLISKKIFESKIEFKDLIGSMMNLGNRDYEEEFDEEA